MAVVPGPALRQIRAMTHLTPRQQQIMERVQRAGFVAIDALAHEFGLTPQTLRRDINALCAAGLLHRHHGGAGLPSSAQNVAYRARRVLPHEAKQRIARAVAERVPNQASIVLTLGTTTEEVARALLGHDGLRVLTNNLNVAATLSQNAGFEVIVAGGVVRSRDRGITGEATIDFVRQFRVDHAITGISGIARDGALLDFDYQEVRVVQAVMSRARQAWVVADHSKFGRHAMVELGHLRDIDALVTDQTPPDPWPRQLAEAGVEIVVAPTA